MMFKKYVDKNQYGGQTMVIELNSLFHIFINETNTSSYVVDFKEHLWISKKTRFSFVSDEDLENTVKKAFDKVYEYFQQRKDYEWSIEQKNIQTNRALDHFRTYYQDR